jgi:hypothetical protein
LPGVKKVVDTGARNAELLSDFGNTERACRSETLQRVLQQFTELFGFATGERSI